MSEKNTSQSRARAPNYTKEEQELFFDVLEPYLHILECKKIDNVTISQKREAWAKVTLAFNSNSKNIPRSEGNLISLYRNLKTKFKKQYPESKFNLTDPLARGKLFDFLELNGEDWSVTKTIHTPCNVRNGKFTDLKKDLVGVKIPNIGTDECIGKNKLCDGESPLKRFKSMLEPNVNSMNKIICNGDTNVTKEHVVIKVEPIDTSDQVEHLEPEIICHVEEYVPSPSESCNSSNNMIHLQSSKTNSEPTYVSSSEIISETKGCSYCSQDLAAEKLKLAQLQTELISMEIKHKQKAQELELQDIEKENKFREEVRAKKLKLLDLEIEKMKE